MAILRRIKDRIKTIIEKKKPLPERLLKKMVKEEKEKKEILGREQVAIEKMKFSTQPTPSKPLRTTLEDLPYQYGKDKIVLQVRDPWWIHTYWEITPSTFDRLRDELKDEFYKARRILRIYDVSQIIFDGKNAHRSFDIQLNEHANNWYIDTGGPGRSWCVDLGLLLSDGGFITIVRSNTVHTPLEGPSWITDEEWMIPEEMFARLYGMGFGFGRSSPVGRAWQERMKRQLFSGFASGGIASMASPIKKIAGERKFWLAVNTELIVYGATEPNAQVLIQGRTLKLRPDGTFTLRFALPDGKQVIPVKAVSSDNQEERTITPIVTKETK